MSLSPFLLYFFFFFHAPPPTELYTLSLHDALPICRCDQGRPFVDSEQEHTMSSMPHPYGASEPVREGEVAQAPAVPTAVVSKRDFPMDEMNSMMDGTYYHLLSALAEGAIQPIGPAFALHHRQPVSTADVEVGFTVDKPLTETLLLPSELEVTGSVLPAGRVGWISHIGGYGGLAEAWGAFTAEIGESEEQMTHPFWEIYVTPPVPGVNPATLRTYLFSMLEPRDV